MGRSRRREIHCINQKFFKKCSIFGISIYDPFDLLFFTRLEYNEVTKNNIYKENLCTISIIIFTQRCSWK